jgi:hypothetical protein
LAAAAELAAGGGDDGKQVAVFYKEEVRLEEKDEHNRSLLETIRPLAYLASYRFCAVSMQFSLFLRHFARIYLRDRGRIAEFDIEIVSMVGQR